MPKLSGQSSGQTIPLWQVDAFADRPFQGNPAAVCVLEQFPEDEWMQNVAAEMNLSETAFVVPTNVSDLWKLRWFTPVVEVDLCGHATLASAHVLFEEQLVAANLPIRFETKSGELTCTQRGRSLELDFPAIPVSEKVQAGVEEEIQRALRCKLVSVAKKGSDVLVVLQDEASVRDLEPDFGCLAKVQTRGVIVTARSDQPGIDFVSRFFAPRFGINEDPVTGSAHCGLAPYWSQELGKNRLVGYQASRRGGIVECELVDDRVRLSGHAVTVMKSQWLGGF